MPQTVHVPWLIPHPESLGPEEHSPSSGPPDFWTYLFLDNNRSVVACCHSGVDWDRCDRLLHVTKEPRVTEFIKKMREIIRDCWVRRQVKMSLPTFLRIKLSSIGCFLLYPTQRACHPKLSESPQSAQAVRLLPKKLTMASWKSLSTNGFFFPLSDKIPSIARNYISHI